MLKHILTGQPSSTAGSRLHHHNDYLQTSAGPAAQRDHHFHHHHLQQHAEQQHQHGLHLPAAVRSSTRAQSSADVYDSVASHSGPAAQRAGPQFQAGVAAQTSGSALGHRHPLNHSQLSVNNLAQRLNASHHSHGLNLSTLSTSKHSVNSVSPVVGAHLANYAERANGRNNLNASQSHTLVGQLQQQQHDRSKINGGLDISRISRLPSQATPSPAPALQSQTSVVASAGPATTSAATTTTTTSTGPSIVPLNVSWSSSSLSRNQKGLEAGVKEMLTSLGLLCLVSLLLALLSLTFLIRMSSVTFMPNGLISFEEYAIVYDVTLVLCALALSLNLCCLLVCAIQFLFAVKLVKSSYHGNRTNKYLQKSSISRVCAVGGFFISIPVFLTGMILYTFIQFQSTPAIVTSVFIGLGIIFCGCALVHTVFVWQKEKTNAMKALRREQYEAAAQLQRQQTLHNQSHSQQAHHQQQNQQQHQQAQQAQQQVQTQQPRSLPLSYGAASRLATNEQLNASGALPRGLTSSAGNHQQLHQLHGHRHVSMSPPLLLSSSAAHAQLNASQRGPGVVLGPASPPATPGDRSPTSPANHKHNRSQQQLMSREATGSVSPGLPTATLDLSSAANTNSPHELSTLV